MKIGIFDSGLGGLIITRAIREVMPQYDYVYFGDTKNMPYGNKTHKEVLSYTQRAVDYLFRQEDCALIIIACNTASARALRQIQQKYLPKNFPNRRVLGVLIPGAEEVSNYKKIGIIATNGTVASKTFPTEINKLNNKAEVFQKAAPMLAPLIEEGNLKEASVYLKEYLKYFEDKNLNALVLGCTHYPIMKKEIRKILSPKIKIISQDELIPKKLKNYLSKHAEISKKLSKNKTIKMLATANTKNMSLLAKKWFGYSKPFTIVTN